MKKKKQIRILCDESIRQVAHNFVLLKENEELRKENEEHRRLYAALSAISKQHAERVEALKEENAKLRTENDIARAQLQDAQEKMRTPVFVPIK